MMPLWMNLRLKLFSTPQKHPAANVANLWLVPTVVMSVGLLVLLPIQYLVRNRSKMFLALHAGAGSHCMQNKRRYKHLLDSITESVMASVLKHPTGTAVMAVVEAIKLLEASPLTNAGICGSNLTLDANVECDASICVNDDRFGAVGAVPLTNSRHTLVIASPIEAAFCVMDLEARGNDAVGRVPPMMICGDAVNAFCAETRSVTMINSSHASQLLSQSQIERYKSHLAILQGASKVRQNETLNDTVGAVAIDRFGNICAGVSSGGISLKRSGRVGEAAHFGSGCWTQSSSHNKQNLKVAISVSGTGEQIMKTQFASLLVKQCFDGQNHSEESPTRLKSFVMNEFINSKKLLDCSTPSVGCIILHVDPYDRVGEFLWSHTTQTMCFSFMHSDWDSSRFIFSSLPNGQKITVGCESIPPL